MIYSERATQTDKQKIDKRSPVQPAPQAGRKAAMKDVSLVFWGTEAFSAPTLEKLLAQGWPVKAVVTKPDAKAGRGQKIISPAVKSIAQRAGIPVLQPEKVSDILPDIERLKPDFGILSAYGNIIPEEIIDLFALGIINIHPSLLPLYRGPSPIETAILSGDKQTGISLMRLTKGMDEGPIYAQKIVPLSGHEDRISLTKELSEQGSEYLLDKLPAIISGDCKAEQQNSSKSTYTKLLTKADGLVDWSEPAELIERKVRAFLGFPKSRATVLDREVVITKARAARNENDGSLILRCQPGYLEILELIAPSGRTMTGADFLRGYSNN